MRVKDRAAAMLLALLWLVPASTLAQEAKPPLSGKNPVRATLVADVKTAALGEEFRLGVLLEMAEGWHIYWTYPGNTGRPTQVSFAVDEQRVGCEEPRFPVPEVFEGRTYEELSFGYSNKVLIPAVAVAFEPPPRGRTELHARVSWLACEKSCVPGEQVLDLELRVGETAVPSEYAELFRETELRLPVEADRSQTWLSSLTWAQGEVHLKLVLGGFADVQRFIPRWSSYQGCKVLEHLVARDEQGRFIVDVKMAGQDCFPGVGGVVEGRQVGERPDAPIRFHDIIAFQRKKEPPPAAEATAGPTPAVPPEAGAPPDDGGEEVVAVIPPAEAGGLWLFLLFAFLGGMLLNVMPCVIPVVVPKLLHVVRTAGKAKTPLERKRLLLANALAYSAGVLATMLALGVVVVILRTVGTEVGWGFQFQNPWFLVFMTSLLLVLGLGMLHVFPLKAASHSDDLRKLKGYRRKSPLLESFMTGLLVTFLGTPCTAPMLGPALGYAFSQGSVVIVTLLLVVGAGLSFPFLLLGVWTGWTRILPRGVTEGYDRVMRGLSFLLFATALWLIAVLADAYGVVAAVRLLWFLLALGFLAWVFGVWAREAEGWSRRSGKLFVVVVLAFVVGWSLLAFPEGERDATYGMRSPAGIAWEEFSDARIAALRHDKKAVFIDFTAEWCMNCKFNERTVIETEDSKRLLEGFGIVAIKADNTRRDSVIQKWLKRFGRAGVPLYLLFPPCASDAQAIVLPEILTSGLFKEAVMEAGSKSYCD